MSKRALITGITGQDGSYLGEFLLKKGYEVGGIVRRLSTPNYWRIYDFLEELKLYDGDLTDQNSLDRAVQDFQPDEVYNLAAQSFVKTSWQQPLATGDTTGMGVVRMLEAVKKFAPNAKFYQASTSEMFGNHGKDASLNETSGFFPTSPYAIAKLYGHYSAINYRQSYGMFTSCGILFNHESPRRGVLFVTRKITDAVARIKLGIADHISLGSLDSTRDWGFAGDYVKAMWLMLQQEEPDDYVVATNRSISVGDFVEAAFKAIGESDWKKYVRQDPRFMRPSDLKHLRGDYSRAKEKLGWEPETSLEDLVKMMVDADIERLENMSETERKVNKSELII